MITATIAAMSIGLMTGSFDATPPSRPSGSIPVGHGMRLLDDTFNSTPAPKNDPSLPGGRRATLRYVWWSVYVKPTGNVEMRTSLTCTHLCENPGNHKHGPPCKIGGCASECPYDGHKTTLTTTSSSSSSSSVSRAISRAQSSLRSVTAKVGASAWGVSAEVSGTASESSSSSVTLGSSISSAVGRSVSGSVDISLGHFNTKPCTSETWWFGTKEYEIRMIIQVFEQDYYSESWVYGGKHGVLPGSGLKLAGEARFVGAPQDVQLGTYQVPSNTPVKKQSDLDCGCKPRAVTTPNPHSDHSSLPSGTSKFYVTPQEDEKVFFTNPTSEPVIVSYADFTVEVKPDEKKEIDRGGSVDPIDVLVTTLAGDPILKAMLRSNPDQFNPEQFNPDMFNPWSSFEREVGKDGHKGGNAETTWKVEKGEKAVIPPGMADEIAAPQDPQEFSLVEVIIAAGLTTNTIPVMNGRTPVLEFRGDIPDGATFTIESGDTQIGGDMFLEIKGVDGETRAAFVKFDGIDGESQSNPPPAKLICRKAGGEIVSEQEIKLQQSAIRLDMTPRTGPAGSSATLIIDTREVVAHMAQSSGAHANQFDIVLSYAGGGGATGPERVPMDPSGITRVPVRRGSVPGGFQVAVSLERRGADKTESTGNDRRVVSDPGFGITKGG